MLVCKLDAGQASLTWGNAARMNKTVFLDYTQAELDLYYDQRRWHPNAEVEIERYATRSAAARARFCPRTYRYGSSEDETLDWFPAGGATAPAVIFMHGLFVRGGKLRGTRLPHVRSEFCWAQKRTYARNARPSVPGHCLGRRT
jgi:hypothetical protein